uniref:Uncharacterized protein n=1 Tax=Anguilla anguilla TaxID=7936 RepID=A0A0E9TMU7_ANGAN
MMFGMQTTASRVRRRL